MQILTAALIVSASLLADPPSVDAPTQADREAYETARAKVGRDAEKHVALAVWCEQHGLKDEAAKHLAMATVIDPSNAKARGLRGQVDDSGTWRTPEKVASRVAEDAALEAKLDEYNRRRWTAPFKAEQQWRLGVWCEEQGLNDEAKAHFELVVRIDPKRDAAWKRLGFKKRNGYWATDEQLAAAKAEAELQKKADKHWIDQFTKWKADVGKDKPERRTEAERGLADVTDPRAVPALMRVFAGTPEGRRRLVPILGQSEGPNASRALLLLAIAVPEDTTRAAASQTLTRRDHRDFVGLLIAQLMNPVKYEVRPVNGPDAPGELLVEGQKFDTRRIYRPQVQTVQTQQGDYTVEGPDGQPYLVRQSNLVQEFPTGLGVLQSLWEQIALGPVLQQRAQALAARGDHSPAALARLFAPIDPMASVPGLGRSPMAAVAAGATGVPMIQFRPTESISLAQVEQENRRAMMDAQQQLDSDVMMIEQYNQTVKRSNDRVLPLLKASTGEIYDDNPEAWATWWANQQGLAFNSQSRTQRPIVNEEVDFQAAPPPILPGGQIVGMYMHSCFGAGTLVHTFAGNKLIEQIRVGDRVLSQDTATGALSYKPVLVAYHNAPAETFRVDMGDDSVVATGIHRFWKAGKGWAMTRELKPGDIIRTIGGTAKVVSVKPTGKQPVFNLELAGGRNFFVGQSGALVHDNSNVEATPEPFDGAKGTEAKISP